MYTDVHLAIGCDLVVCKRSYPPIIIMVSRKAGTMLIAFFAIFVITNVDIATSLQCYECVSNSTGSCWSSPQNSELKECEQGSTSTTTSGASSAATTASITPSSSNPTTASEDSSAPTTTTISPSSSNPPATSTPGASSTATTASITPSSSNPSTASEDSSASTTTTISSSSSNPATTLSTVTPETATRSSVSTSITATSSAPEDEQSQASTAVTAATETFASGDVRVLFKNGKNARLKRNILAQADNNDYLCAKILYKDGDTDMIKRTCIVKRTTPCEEDKKQLNASSCDVCDNDRCNRSSNMSFEYTSMIIPLAMAFYMLSQT